MTEFKQIEPRQIDENAIKLIGSDWMLITAGNLDSCNNDDRQLGWVRRALGPQRSLLLHPAAQAHP